MPRAFCKHSKTLIASLIAYFEAERDNHGPLLPLEAVRERTAAALNISITSISRISADIRKGNVPVSPKRKREKKKPVVDIDDFSKCAIRNAVYDMYREKKHITIKTLNIVLQERDIFKGGQTSLWKILHNIGFHYNKDDPKRGLIELPHIALKRVNFLSDYIRIKKEGIREFVFLDETWIFQGGNITRSWQDSDKRSVRTSKVGGKRLIILHAGNAKGFIKGAELIFPSGTNSADYHGEMNRANFLYWFENQLILNLEEPSVIVMDNASYHSTILNKSPTTASTKAEIQQWLDNNNIPYDVNLLKIQLLDLVRRHNAPVVFEIDELAQKYGHMILRLPPYHCIFNPIENIWGIAKNYYVRHVEAGGKTLENSKAIWKDALNSITANVWANTIAHTEKEIQKWWNREIGMDHRDVEEFIINLGEDSSDESVESS